MNIKLPEEISTLRSALRFVLCHNADNLLTILGYHWIFPTYIVAALGTGKEKDKEIVYECQGREFAELEEYRSLMTDEHNVDREMTDKEAAKARELQEKLIRSSPTKDLFSIIEAIRTTTPKFRDVRTNYPYSRILNHFEKLPVESGDKWYRICGDFLVRSKIDFITFLTLLRTRAKSNINMVYRVTKGVAVDVEGHKFLPATMSTLGPAGILNTVRKDAVSIGLMKVRRAEKSDVPRKIWQGSGEIDRKFLAVVEGPGTKTLYMGRTMIVGTPAEEVNPDDILDHLRSKKDELEEVKVVGEDKE